MLESGKGMELNFKNEEKPSYFEIIFKRLKQFIFEVQFLVLKYQSTFSIFIFFISSNSKIIINNFSLKIFNNQKNYFE